MSTAPAPASKAPKPAPPPPPKTNGRSEPKREPNRVGSSKGPKHYGQRIGIYGPGGVGKTELVANVQQVGIEPWFIDLDRGSLELDVSRAEIDDRLVSTFEEIRDALHSWETIANHDLLAIDTFTVLEERVRDWVIANVPHEKAGKAIHRIEDYGFGKGLSHIYETALLVLQDLDAVCRKGKHVVIVCHQCAEKAPSAESEDYLEYQPRLQSPPKSGKLRERVFEWCNHFFRIDIDRAISDGKAAASDVRSIHTTRTSTAWAKHRALQGGRELPDVIPFPKGDVELWKLIFGEQGN